MCVLFVWLIRGGGLRKGRLDKKLHPLLPSLPRLATATPSLHHSDGSHAQPRRCSRDDPLRRSSSTRQARRHDEDPLRRHHHHEHSSERPQGGGDGGHAGGLGRPGRVPGGGGEQLRGEDAGERGHAAPHPHPDPLRALPLPRAAPARRRAARRGGRPPAPPQGGRLAAALPVHARQRRRPAQARVRLEGQGPGLRRGAGGQDRQGARRERVRPREARLRGAQPSQSTALLHLPRRPERERLHHRRQDRPDQDPGSHPQEEGLGVIGIHT